jgi:hypothetical protein
MRTLRELLETMAGFIQENPSANNPDLQERVESAKIAEAANQTVDGWNESQGNLDMVYWRTDPNNPDTRWHVAKQLAGYLGSVRGQIIRDDGWYWYSRDSHGGSSPMVGPSETAQAAMMDCEVSFCLRR